MESLSSCKEEAINTISSNGVFGEFIDPFTNATNKTVDENAMLGNKTKPTMYYYFNDHLIQVFHNKNNANINNNNNNNNIDLTESSELLLQITLKDLELLKPVQQIKQVLSSRYENKPILIIVATFVSEDEEKDVYKTLFWVDVLSGAIKLVLLEEPLTGTICSSHAMYMPMKVPAGTTEKLSKITVSRQVLAFGMQDGSIRMIMLEYPIRGDVFYTSSKVIKASELDGSPVTAVELFPPDSHHQFYANSTTIKGGREYSMKSPCHEARLVAGTINGLLINHRIQPMATINVCKQNRIKGYTYYDTGAITRIKTLRDSKAGTKCIVAVAQDSSWDIGRAVTDGYNKQACVNIIELYGNGKKNWLFVIRPSNLEAVACEVSSMRLVPASIGYSIIIVFRAIHEDVSEIVCHSIFPKLKGNLDFSFVINGSSCILDAYPHGDTYLGLTQKALVQKPKNTTKSSSNQQLESFESKSINRGVVPDNSITAESLVNVISNQFLIRKSQTDKEHDLAHFDNDEDDSKSIREISPVMHDVDDKIDETHHQEREPEDPVDRTLDRSQNEMGVTNDICYRYQQPTETTGTEKGTRSVHQIKVHHKERHTTSENYRNYDDDNINKEETSMNCSEVEYEHVDTQQGTSEVIACPGYDVESFIVNHATSDTSASSEDGTYLSTAEESKEVSPDTSGTDEPVQKSSRMPQVFCAEENEEEEERTYMDVNQSSDELIENHQHNLIDSVYENKCESMPQSPPPSSPYSDNLRLTYPFTPENSSASLSLTHSCYQHQHSHPFQYQNREQSYISSSPQSIPNLSNSIITEESNNGSYPWPSLNTTAATSTASPSPKMLKADEDTASPSPLQLNDDDHEPDPPSPYEYIPMSPDDLSFYQKIEEECEDGEIIEDSPSPFSSPKPILPTTSGHYLFLQDQPQVDRTRSVNRQLFIDVMLQDLYYKYDKSYPTLSLELELLLARPANTHTSHWKTHTHARYYIRLRETEDGQVINKSNIYITDEDKNLVITCWLLDRCKYEQALTYLRKCRDTSPYAYKIMKTLELGLGVEEARARLEEIETMEDDNATVFHPEVWVQLLQEDSLASALAYINKNKRAATIRNDLMKVVCNTLLHGSSTPSVQDIRQLGIYDYADEQRDWLLTFAHNTDSIASNTLLIYLYLKKEQKGEGVLLNRRLQKEKPKAGLSAKEEALYKRCQELEDKVYALEPALARELPPEIVLFPPGQARPPYENFFQEHGLDAARVLLGPVFLKQLEASRKRSHELSTNNEGRNPSKHRKL